MDSEGDTRRHTGSVSRPRRGSLFKNKGENTSMNKKETIIFHSSNPVESSSDEEKDNNDPQSPIAALSHEHLITTEEPIRSNSPDNEAIPVLIRRDSFGKTKKTEVQNSNGTTVNSNVPRTPQRRNIDDLHLDQENAHDAELENRLVRLDDIRAMQERQLADFE